MKEKSGWYLKVDGQERGPLSKRRIKSMLRTGKLSIDVLASPDKEVWHSISEWELLSGTADETAKFEKMEGLGIIKFDEVKEFSPSDSSPELPRNDNSDLMGLPSDIAHELDKFYRYEPKGARAKARHLAVMRLVSEHLNASESVVAHARVYLLGGIGWGLCGFFVGLFPVLLL